MHKNRKPSTRRTGVSPVYWYLKIVSSIKNYSKSNKENSKDNIIFQLTNSPIMIKAV